MRRFGGSGISIRVDTNLGRTRLQTLEIDMLKKIGQTARQAFCSKVIYAGLALAYGAACFGADKEAVHMAATALYTALVMARH